MWRHESIAPGVRISLEAWLDRAAFSTADRFDTYGLDSVEAVIMAGVMEEEFQVIVDPHRFFETPSIDEFTAAFTAPAA